MGCGRYESYLSTTESAYEVSIGPQVNQSFAQCGNVIATESTLLCMETSLLFATASEIGPPSFVVDSTDVR